MRASYHEGTDGRVNSPRSAKIEFLTEKGVEALKRVRQRENRVQGFNGGPNAQSNGIRSGKGEGLFRTKE